MLPAVGLAIPSLWRVVSGYLCCLCSINNRAGNFASFVPLHRGVVNKNIFVAQASVQSSPSPESTAVEPTVTAKGSGVIVGRANFDTVYSELSDRAGRWI